MTGITHSPRHYKEKIENLLGRLWRSAKLGVCINLGPLALHLRVARRVRISSMAARPPLSRTLSNTTQSVAVPAETASAKPAETQTASTTTSALPGGVALIVGTGPGLGSALACRFAQAGMAVAVVARQTEKLEGLVKELFALGGSGRAYACDATQERTVQAMLQQVVQELGVPDLVVYNVEEFIPGTLLEIETPAFEACWRAMTLGGFIVGREVARLMVPRGSGTIIYTGATAALRGRADYINMAVGKFGVRALAQSMARDLGPQGIHVAHVVLDGGILSPRSGETATSRCSSLFPAHIAETYFQLHLQHKSTWTQELDLRPWVEKF